jgi:hypothetical protein
MPSLLVVIFVVELVVQLVNTFGATTINSLVRAHFLGFMRLMGRILTGRLVTAMEPLHLLPDTTRTRVRRTAQEAEGVPGCPA